MRRRTKTARLWLLAFGAVALLLYAGWWSLCEWVIYPSLGYDIAAEFVEVPPDDEALTAWLRQQPGVAVVGINRTESGKATRIQVLLIMSRNLHNKPPFPNLENACAELGYRGQMAPFRDVNPRRP